MDMRTGQMYHSYQEARDAGVPESDIALVEPPARPGQPPRVTFPKHQPFKSFKNRAQPVAQ